MLAACDKSAPSGSGDSSLSSTPAAQSSPSTINAATLNYPVYTYDIINTWPHDRGAFTQGLVYLDGALLESTGLYGQSSLRTVELATGKVLKEVDVPAQYFAEGLAELNGKLFQLTWQGQKGFVYDLNTFKQEKEFTYQGEGWGGLTTGRPVAHH